jgi:transcription termination factor Rho
MGELESMEFLLDRLTKTKANNEFWDAMKR